MKYVLLAHTFYIKSFDGCIFISFTHLKEVLFEVPFLNVGVKMFIVEAFNGAILDFPYPLNVKSIEPNICLLHI